MRLFSEGEMRRRLDALRGEMDRSQVDAVITTSFHNTLYYTGFWMFPFGRFYGSVIPKEGDVALFAPSINQLRAEDLSWAKDMRFYPDQTSTLVGGTAEIKKVFKDRGLAARRIGMEEDTVPVRTLNYIKEALPGSEFVDISDVMMMQRVIKSKEEIDVQRTNAAISDVALQAFVDAIAEGKTETELCNVAIAALDAELARRYPDLESFGSAVFCESGIRTMRAHSLATGRKIKRGDNMVFNVLSNLVGYYISNERTVFVGSMPEAMKKPFEATMEAHEWMLQAIKPGIRCSDVAKTVNSILDKRGGYSQYQRHGPGHDAGILAYFWGRGEKANFRNDNDTLLEEGMVVTVEPGIYVPDIGGIRHCDVVAVTKDGNEPLTKFRRGLITAG